jgi:hypothetical protein
VRRLWCVFGGSVWVVVAVLVMLWVGVSCGCCGYEWQEGRRKGGISVGFVSKNVTRGWRGRGNALSVRYGSVVRSMSVKERRVDFCCEVDVGVDLESMRDDEILLGCNFIYYATLEGMVVDVGGMIFRNAESSSSLQKGLWGNRVWSYGFYVGTVMENVIFRPSLYCIYRSYTDEIILEGRGQYEMNLLPLGLRDFVLRFSGELGYDRTGKPYGLPYASSLGRRGYWYYGAAICLIYKLSSGEASVGVAYEGNAAEKYSWVNRGRSYRDNVWFNAFLNFSF